MSLIQSVGFLSLGYNLDPRGKFIVYLHHLVHCSIQFQQTRNYVKLPRNTTLLKAIDTLLCMNITVFIIHSISQR